MPYKQLIIGDANVGRIWQVVQGNRTSLQSTRFASATCPDTLLTGLNIATDEFDLVIVSVATALLLDEGAASSGDVRGTTKNVLSAMVKQVSSAAKKSQRVEVRDCLLKCMLYLSILSMVQGRFLIGMMTLSFFQFVLWIF